MYSGQIVTFACLWFAVATLGGAHSRLTKQLLEQDDIHTMPVRGENETVNAEMAINLLKVIQMVWKRAIVFVKPIHRSEAVENAVPQFKLIQIQALSAAHSGISSEEFRGRNFKIRVPVPNIIWGIVLVLIALAWNSQNLKQLTCTTSFNLLR